MSTETEHVTGVATQAGPHGTTAIAWCRCGWQAVLMNRLAAQASAEGHISSVAHASADPERGAA